MFTRSTSMVVTLLIVCLNTVLAQSPPPVSFVAARTYGTGSGPISVAISVGLGTNVDKAFLQQIANDPSSSTYNPNLPAGMAMFARNCPSSTCTADMQQIFQTIAAQILLSLTL